MTRMTTLFTADGAGRPADYSDDCLKLGLLARIATLAGDSAGAEVDFAALRESCGLLPELLINAIEELRVARCLTFREQGSNPYGCLSITPQGARILELAGPAAQQLLDYLPQSCRNSSPERSSRYGGKRGQEAGG